MKRIQVLIIGVLLFCLSVDAQQRVTDATDSIPVAAASIFDADGNVIGYTLADGSFSEISPEAYPITLRCLGYEPLVIEQPKDTAWKMKPCFFDMQELVVVPVERNILKQTFYIREYFSISNETDTVTYFSEHMAHRFVPASKGVKTGISSSMHIDYTRSYSHYKDADTDSVAMDDESQFPFMISLLEVTDKEITAPKDFMTQNDGTKVYEKKGKSGVLLIKKQNGQVFSFTGDVLAEMKDHVYSPWALKLLGMTMDINQMYITKAFRVNDEGHYIEKDLLQSNFVMEADCRGKNIRKMLKSDQPVLLRMMAETYVVEREYFSKKEAQAERKKPASKANLAIPSNVPPLNDATQRLVNRAKFHALR